jgi:hypothetical protein
MLPAVLDYKIRNKQVTMKNNSLGYMFLPHGVISWLASKTY